MLRMAFILLILLFIYPLSSWAKEPLCDQITIHHTYIDDVTYKPGIDVRGKAVVPADLNSQSHIIPDVITVPLTVDLAERLGQAPPDGVQLEAPLGIVEIHQNGRVLFNGKDLTAETVALCSENQLKTEAPSDDKMEEEAPAPVIHETDDNDDEIIWGEAH